MSLAVETERLGGPDTLRPRKAARPVKPQDRIRVALTDVDLAISTGELFGVLGPNGAGKTTLIKILTTLLAPSSGRARVAGHDVVREPHQVRPLINMVSGGESSGYGLLTVRENLWMFAQFYGMRSADANRRIRELLGVVKMSDRIDTKCYELSTGLRQKMNIVRGFLTDPDVLFLDEPTLGLDVGASREVRAFIRLWMGERPGRTVLLTTHYMVEADELCDRVAIINGGRLLACDRPAALKRRLQQDAVFRLETTSGTADPLAAVSAIEGLPGVRQAVRTACDGYVAIDLVLERDHVLGGVIAALQSWGIRLLNLTKREPTLEDVFVDLVGRSMADVERGDDRAV
jgi:ABC-2 type transport system ATP-binding protein